MIEQLQTNGIYFAHAADLNNNVVLAVIDGVVYGFADQLSCMLGIDCDPQELYDDLDMPEKLREIADGEHNSLPGEIVAGLSNIERKYDLPEVA